VVEALANPPRSEILRNLIRIGLAVLAAGALTTVFAGAAGAATPRAATHGSATQPPFDGVVFVQTDNTSGNEIVAYDRAGNGSLAQAGTYATGGLGGQLTGSVVDHLASQDSLVASQSGDALYAVNAGSNTVSVFSVRGDRLFLREVIGSGGTFPVSIAARGDLVYVVNALAGGSVQGYFSFFGLLFPLPGSNRPLGLNPSATPQFVNTPGQVAFSPDGAQLIVTTKANGGDIDVFQVGRDGLLSTTPVVNAEPGAVPFAINFDQAGDLVIAEAGTNALATFTLNAEGTVTPIEAVPTGQAATCWVATTGEYFFASNAGSATVSRYASTGAGEISLLGATSTDTGTVDAAVAPGDGFLYVQAGGPGTVDEFQVGNGGSLSPAGSVTVPGAAGGEGIVAL
jgi:6-phosphogluconolactonase (cycloisomerase 2 family)